MDFCCSFLYFFLFCWCFILLSWIWVVLLFYWVFVFWGEELTVGCVGITYINFKIILNDKNTIKKKKLPAHISYLYIPYCYCLASEACIFFNKVCIIVTEVVFLLIPFSASLPAWFSGSVNGPHCCSVWHCPVIPCQGDIIAWSLSMPLGLLCLQCSYFLPLSVSYLSPIPYFSLLHLLPNIPQGAWFSIVQHNVPYFYDFPWSPRYI